jgi:hypothetical protein
MSKFLAVRPNVQVAFGFPFKLLYVPGPGVFKSGFSGDRLLLRAKSTPVRENDDRLTSYVLGEGVSWPW